MQKVRKGSATEPPLKPISRTSKSCSQKLAYGLQSILMKLTKSSIFKALEANIAELKTFGVDKIGLFGSYVKNKQNVNSDIDILVSIEKRKKDLMNFMTIKLYLEDLFGAEVDLVLREAIKQKLKNKIEKEVLYVK